MKKVKLIDKVKFKLLPKVKETRSRVNIEPDMLEATSTKGIKRPKRHRRQVN